MLQSSHQVRSCLIKKEAACFLCCNFHIWDGSGKGACLPKQSVWVCACMCVAMWRLAPFSLLIRVFIFLAAAHGKPSCRVENFKENSILVIWKTRDQTARMARNPRLFGATALLQFWNTLQAPGQNTFLSKKKAALPKLFSTSSEQNNRNSTQYSRIQMYPYSSTYSAWSCPKRVAGCRNYRSESDF